jgi:UDPglucose 6-dehydrogenase
MKFDNTIIGIIGIGFVGSAVSEAYTDNDLCDVLTIDLDPMKTNSNYTEMIENAEAIFVCVPSPAKANGDCDTSILEDVIGKLKDYKGVIISKVTAPPNVYEKLQERHSNLVHVPEFLVAATAIRDYATETYSIIGGKVPAYQREAERIIKLGQRQHTASAFTSIGEASLTKYIINSFLATKVVFMNEMYQLSTNSGYNWDMMRILIDMDPRIGKSHTQVPGPDGSFGFGGMCFPKDTNALIKYASKLDTTLNVLKSAVKKNDLYRLQKPK